MALSVGASPSRKGDAEVAELFGIANAVDGTNRLVDHVEAPHAVEPIALVDGKPGIDVHAHPFEVLVLGGV